MKLVRARENWSTQIIKLKKKKTISQTVSPGTYF